MRRFVIVLCLLFFPVAFTYAQQSGIAASDFDKNGRVEFSDFLLFAAGFGKTTGQTGFNTALDLNNNGAIDFPDFLIFAQNFGKSPSDPQIVHLYIADLTSSRVEVVDVSTNLLDPSRTLFAAQPRGVAPSKINKHIYVAAVDTFYAFTEIGTAVFKRSLVAQTAPGNPIESRGGFRVILNKNHTRAYVTEEIGSSVEVFDLPEGTPKTLIPVPRTPSGIVISPDDSRLYIAHGDGSKAVSIINTASLTRTDSLLVNQSVTRLAISPDGALLYFNNTHGNTLLVVNPTTKATLKTLTLGETSDANVQILDVAITPDGKKLAAAFNRIYFGFDTQGNPVPIFWGGIALFDTATWTKTAEVRAGDLVANMGMTPDGLTIYLAGAQSLTDQSTGNLQVSIFDVTTTSILGTIRGLSLPVAFSFGSSKPAIPQFKMPEWFVF